MKRMYLLMIGMLVSAGVSCAWAERDTHTMFRKTVHCIESNCYDEPIIATLEEASEQFGIPELKTYALLRKENYPDTCNRKTIHCIDQLIAYADRTWGVPSYEGVYLRFARLNLIIGEERWDAGLADAVPLAEALYQKDRQDANKELWYLSRLLPIIGNGTAHDPTQEMAFVHLMLEIDDFYQSHPRTEVKWKIYGFAGAHLNTFGRTYPQYANCIGNLLEIERKNDTLFQSTIDTLYLSGTVPVYAGCNRFQKESFYCYKELFEDCPIELVMDEIAYLATCELRTDDPDAMIRYLVDKYEQVTAYWGEDDFLSVYSNLYLRQIAQRLDRTLPATFQRKMFSADAFLPENIRSYIGYLYSEISADATNTLFVRGKCREMRELAEKYYSNHPVRRLGSCMAETYLQRQNAWGYENTFASLMFEFENLSRTHACWELVEIGKELAEIAETVFFRINDALRIEYEIVRMVRDLASESSLVFKAEYVQYLLYATKAYPVQPRNLDGSYGMDALIASVEQSTAHTIMLAPVHWVVASYYDNAGDPVKVAELSKAIIDEVQQEQKQYHIPHFYRDIELDAYSLWLKNTNDLSEKEWKKQIRNLEALYFDTPEFIRFSSTQILADYHATLREWDKALRVLDFALEQFDVQGYNFWDGLYVQIIQMKVQVLISSKADLDQCRQLAERLDSELKKVKEIGNYGVYLNMILIMCQLTNISSPNDILHYRNVRLFYDKAKEFYEASGRLDQVAYNFLLPAYTTMCQTVFNNFNSAHPTEFYLLCQDIKETVMPDLQKMEERFRELFPDEYWQSSNYLAMIADLGMACDIAGYTDLGKTYFDMLAPHIPQEIDILYMIHYAFAQDAKNVQSYMQRFFGKGVDNDVYGANSKRFIILGKCTDAMVRGKWKDAERYAWEYYAATQEYMQQNLDYFTQSETEQFLMQNGVGGAFIQGLVGIPDVNQKKKLIEQSYDINLQQKGLMLRKANRLRQAVEATGDTALKAMLDSVQLLQRELREVDESQLTVSGNTEEIAKRERLFSLERQLARATQQMEERQEKEVSWRDVRDHLRSGEAAVEYVVFQQIVYALVLTPKCTTPQYVQLEKGTEVGQYLFNVLTNGMLTEKEKAEHLYGDESPLYEALWKPIEPYFKGAKTIYFSPTDALNLLCFQAIRINATECLIDRYELHQLTNTALLAERDKSSETLSSRKQAKVYGAIYYNSLQRLSESRVAQLRAQNEPEEVVLAVNRSPLHDAFPFLKNTLFEADGIYGVLDQMGVQATEKIGDAPSENELRSLSGHSPDIIHLATHGFFYSDPEQAKQIPFFRNGGELNAMTCSGVALANAEPAWLGHSSADSKEDNILTSSEVSELNLRNTKLVVLSACQTGLGSTSADGVFGLQRGFKQAGVESICASLWSVADRATSDMMQAFYTYWISGHMTMHAAMKRAMQEQRERTPSPYFWAPFVLLDAIE